MAAYGVKLSNVNCMYYTVECYPPNPLCTSELFKLCQKQGMRPTRTSKYDFRFEVMDADQAEFEQVLIPWLRSKGLLASQNEYVRYTFYDTNKPITPFPQEFTLRLGGWQDQSSDIIDPPINFCSAYVDAKTETKDYTLVESAASGNLRFVRMNAGEPNHQDVIRICYEVLEHYGFDPPTNQFVKDGMICTVFRKSVVPEQPTTSKKRKRNLRGNPVLSFTTSASNSAMTLATTDSLIEQVKTKTNGTIIICLTNGESVHVSCNTEGQQTVAVYQPDDP